MCIKIDDRGRISIPADVRKTFALNSGDLLDLVVSISERRIELRKNGCDGVTINRRTKGASVRSSITVCEAVGSGESPGRGLKVMKND